jgi:cytochrome P450
VLAEIVRRVELELQPGYEARVVRRSVTLAPSQGVPVIASPRAAA